MQWRIDPSDRDGSYVYVVLRISSWRLFIAIIIRISDLNGNRYWSLSSIYNQAPVWLLPLMFVEVKVKAQIYTRLSSTNIGTTTASDGNSYRMLNLTYCSVCILDMFLNSNLTYRSWVKICDDQQGGIP
jgi:hypothetical protein